MTVACALNATAIPALLQIAPGHEIVPARIERTQCMVSADSLTEVLTRLTARCYYLFSNEVRNDSLRKRSTDEP